MSKRLLDDAVLKYIDAKLMRDGNITTVDVSKAFDLSRQKASALFTVYREQRPDNMFHCVKRRKYIKGKGFEAYKLPVMVSPEKYLESVRIVFLEDLQN